MFAQRSNWQVTRISEHIPVVKWYVTVFLFGGTERWERKQKDSLPWRKDSRWNVMSTLASQRRPSPHSWKCESVTLLGKQDFADMLQVRKLSWGDCPGWFGWTPSNLRGLSNGKMKAGAWEPDKTLWWWKQRRDRRCYTGGLKERGKGPEPKNAASRSWKRQGNGISPRTSLGMNRGWHLAFS